MNRTNQTALPKETDKTAPTSDPPLSAPSLAVSPPTDNVIADDAVLTHSSSGNSPLSGVTNLSDPNPSTTTSTVTPRTTMTGKNLSGFSSQQSTASLASATKTTA